MSRFQVSFSCHLDRPVGLSIGSLEGWQPSVLRRLQLGPATIEPDAGSHRFRQVVQLRHHGRPLAMELRVTPWSSPMDTHLELVPLRRLRANRRYFRNGRVLLADAVGRIQAPISAADQPPLFGLAISA